MLEERKKCTELTEKVLSVMITDNYSRKRVDNHMRYVYSSLTKYCDDHFEGEYFIKAGEAFMRMIYERKMSKEQTSLYLYQNGVELELISRILGHASTQTTRIYATPSMKMLKEAMGTATEGIPEEEPLWMEDEAELARLCRLR